MDCEESIVLLGEFHAGTLDEPQTVLVRQHLVDCRPCGGVYSDIEVLVLAARALDDQGEGLSYPARGRFRPGK
ncbi:MAG: zf-HC2 domain-containing protein, partial [Pyrinomonadaceae bacterium]